MWLLALLSSVDEIGLQRVDLGLLLEIEYGNFGRGSSAKPVSVRREDKSVDLVTSLQRVEVLGLVEIPQHSGTVLSTGCAERTVGRDGDSVDVAGVADVVGLDAARSEFPNLLDDVSFCLSQTLCEIW